MGCWGLDSGKKGWNLEGGVWIGIDERKEGEDGGRNGNVEMLLLLLCVCEL